MAVLPYLNFDVQFAATTEGYRIELSGPDGRYSGTFRLPVTNTELENLVLRVGRTRRAMRRIDHPEIDAAKQFGRRLYNSVFADQIGQSFQRSLELAEQQQAGLRIRIHLTNTPELANLPWEYLYDERMNRFLSLSIETPLVRYLEIPERIRPLAVSPPLRVLAIIANPTGQPPLDVEREWANIQAAVSDLHRRGALVLERLERPTMSDLQRRLRRADYHILHFVGHGTFDSRAQDGVLLLEDAQRDDYRVSGQELGTLLHDQRSLRLVMLNVCEGGRSAADDPFAGVAQSLVQQGIPAVIAMQFEVSDDAAIALAHEFYGALTDGYPVDAALAEARKSVFAQGFRLEWGTPVLYLRAADGQIFDTAAGTARQEPKPDQALQQRIISEQYRRALSLFYTRQWDEAITAFEEVLRSDPAHTDATTKLQQAQRELQLAQSYEQGQQAFAQRDWEQAIRVLQEVAALDLQYKDTATMLQSAQRQKNLAELYSEARSLHQAHEWQSVLGVFARMEEIEPSFSDPEQLQASTRAALEAEQRSAQLQQLYDQGLASMQQEQWTAALAAFEKIDRVQPDYLDTTALMGRLREELKSNTPSHPQKADAQPRPLRTGVRSGKPLTRRDFLVLAGAGVGVTALLGYTGQALLRQNGAAASAPTTLPLTQPPRLPATTELAGQPTIAPTNAPPTAAATTLPPPTTAPTVGSPTIGPLPTSAPTATLVAQGKGDPNWPPRPDFLPLNSTAERQAIFGTFEYRSAPIEGNPERIEVLGSWTEDNIRSVQVPQLAFLASQSIPGVPADGVIHWHRLAVEQLLGMWKAWGDAGLLDRILSYGGAYIPRLLRGSTTVLSSHSFGTAFDINYDWNQPDSTPALVGEKGSVRELVPIANTFGFYWGGNYGDGRYEGNHFEVAVLRTS